MNERRKGRKTLIGRNGREGKQMERKEKVR